MKEKKAKIGKKTSQRAHRNLKTTILNRMLKNKWFLKTESNHILLGGLCLFQEETVGEKMKEKKKKAKIGEENLKGLTEI